MQTNELMFFAGAPLAHVVAYEERRRLERIRLACERARRGMLRRI